MPHTKEVWYYMTPIKNTIKQIKQDFKPRKHKRGINRIEKKNI